jgi:hypothetical protein
MRVPLHGEFDRLVRAIRSAFGRFLGIDLGLRPRFDDGWRAFGIDFGQPPLDIVEIQLLRAEPEYRAACSDGKQDHRQEPREMPRVGNLTFREGDGGIERLIGAQGIERRHVAVGGTGDRHAHLVERRGEVGTGERRQKRIRGNFGEADAARGKRLFELAHRAAGLPGRADIASGFRGDACSAAAARPVPATRDPLAVC